MKLLLTGVSGQLRQVLQQQLPAGLELIATSHSGDGGAVLMTHGLAEATTCLAEALEHWTDFVLIGRPTLTATRAERETAVDPQVNESPREDATGNRVQRFHTKTSIRHRLIHP